MNILLNMLFSCFSLLLIVTNATPNIHIFTFHHSDRATLMDWYIYHSNIIGFNNIHAIAHQSYDTDIVRSLQALGADIIPYDGEFADKAKVITKHMQKYVGDSAFLVPMDVDEYLVAEVNISSGLTFTTNVTQIRIAFSSLPVDGYKYKLHPYMGYSCGGDDVNYVNKTAPRRVAHFFRTRKTLCGSKTFFHSKGFVQTDQGNHFGVVDKDRSECSTFNPLFKANCGRCFHNVTGLGLLHYGNMYSLTYDEFVAKALRGAAVYNQSATSNCHVGGGQHYCEFLANRRKMGDTGMKEGIEAQKLCRDKLHNSEVRDALEKLYSTRNGVTSSTMT